MLPLVLLGARTHNLKRVSLILRPGEVTTLTGVSGSGKSSLALQTLYAEGQRRFVESFSPYARQFLERLERPPMDSLEPVPAAVAVDRAAAVKSSRSTVATMADLAPLLSGLFQREALPTCPEHHAVAVKRSATNWSEILITGEQGRRAVVTYEQPIKGTEDYLEVRDRLAQSGQSRLWLNGQLRPIDSVAPSEIGQQRAVSVVVDRVAFKSDERARVAEALQRGFSQGGGRTTVHVLESRPARALQRPVEHTVERSINVQDGLCCPVCSRALAPAVPGLFSYDSPLGACPTCRGFGRVIGIDRDKVIPDLNKSLKQRAIRPWSGKSTEWERAELRKLCTRHQIPLDVPFKDLSSEHQDLVWSGDGAWELGLFPGVLGWFAWMETRTYKMHVRVLLSKYRSYDPCPECAGARLNEAARGYHVRGKNLAEWNALEITDALSELRELEPQTGQGRLIKEQLCDRFDYLQQVGLGYLSLDRQARTLSGGENQRVTLTAALGTSLHNALFVLDEPSVGLHPTDVQRLALVIQRLASRNNMVLMVEHDADLISASSRIIEMGPGAGSAGGEVVFDGDVEQAYRAQGATARALTSLSVVGTPRRELTDWLKLSQVHHHNLRNIDVRIPLRAVTVVSGPSGSGKSTLCVGVLYRALARQLGEVDVSKPGTFGALSGADHLTGITLIDQSALGRTSRGNAATYTKAWDHVRKLFASEPAAQQRNLTASHFSFNVDLGRCDACAGEGFETVEMQFLADVHLECPVCKGKRFKPEVLTVSCRGHNVADVLDATVEQALEWFSDCTPMLRALGPVKQLGLGYLRLGQPLSTLSGGEAQRLKLARALSDRVANRLFIVDEPSASLHADEVGRVLECFDWLVEGGATVVAVEHDLALIARADWVVELGPGGGRNGGSVVFEGTAAQLLSAATATGSALLAKVNPAPFKRAQVNVLPLAKAELEIKNAREHTLKNVSVTIPHQQLTVVTGPSGSGKSSLVFDVMFAEGQRRFLETLTPYARQFLPTMPKPDVDEVTGVPPSIALEQRTSRAGTNSTVATVTELAHYLRLLFAKLGTAHCPEHQQPITATSRDQLLAQLRGLKGKVTVLAPIVHERKGTYLDVFNAADRDGIATAWCDGSPVETANPPKLVRSKEHTIDLEIRQSGSLRTLAEADLDRALSWGAGKVKLRRESGETYLYGTASACLVCGLAVPELDPRWFSFNTKQGACPKCEGSGVVEAYAPPKKPARKSAKGDKAKAAPAEPTAHRTCPACSGTRLAPIPRAVRMNGLGYHDYNQMTVSQFSNEVRSLHFAGPAKRVAEPILKELERRVAFLLDVGLDYLSLSRPARTLSGGELQRLRLAAQLGAGLTGALYVLDEPTIGLHPRDTTRLIRNLRDLVALGSTVVVVEHDADVIRAADYLVDMGPSGGRDGGQVVAFGKPEAALSNPASPTARELNGLSAPRVGRTIDKRQTWIEITGVTANNLKSVDFSVPEQRLTVVAGVSGSGKSTLVRSVFLPALREALGLVTQPAGPFRHLSSTGGIKRALSVDQSPIGRTPRSVPATFLGIWDAIRQLFAKSPEGQVAGFSAARFSFNTPSGGRCTTCGGQGYVTHEMSFLPDVIQVCPECDGLRFDLETLRVRYRGLSIGEVLQLSAEEACEVFANHSKLVAPLRTLVELGAGYLKLGQGSHTLSGGEAQRLKLAAELTASVRHEPTLYVLDEPTTGLHQSDVARLVSVLDRLVERGDTLVVIEHHPWFIAGADHVIELGPDGGDAGGRVVASGTPAHVAHQPTATGRVLASLLTPSQPSRRRKKA